MTDSSTPIPDNSKTEGHFAKHWVWWVAGLVVVLLIIAFIFFQYDEKYNSSLKINHDKFSAFGEFVGGVIGTIIALVTLILVFFTYKSQKEELKGQREQFIHSRLNEYIFKEIDYYNQRFSKTKLGDISGIIDLDGQVPNHFERLDKVVFDKKEIKVIIVFPMRKGEASPHSHTFDLKVYEIQIFIEFVEVLSGVIGNINGMIDDVNERTKYWYLYRERTDKTIFNFLNDESRKLERLLNWKDSFSSEQEFNDFKQQLSNFREFFTLAFYLPPISESGTTIFTRVTNDGN